MNIKNEIKLYDTREEELKPVRSLRNDGIIRMYICGPTVYDYSHIGHFKTFIVYDSLVRFLRFSGYSVMHVMNITDIDDKIIDRAKREGVSYKEVSRRFEEDFFRNWVGLNLLPPYSFPRATYHITDMIRIIEGLIEKGYAYESDGDVYFSVEKFDKYGEISKQRIDELIPEYRVKERGKRNPLDFALWKKAEPGEPCWESPWGLGRPGWHIECTAMSYKLLDPPFEIHGGGEDLKFPHHENERAQTNSFIGDEAVYIWTHVGVLKMEKEKMSKSLGNIVVMKDLLAKYNPDIIRILILSSHYRKQSEYTEEKLREAIQIYTKIKRTYSKLTRLDRFGGEDSGYENALEDMLGHLANDFNTAAALNSFLHYIDRLDRMMIDSKLSKRGLKEGLKFYDVFKEIFGLTLGEEVSSDKILKLLVEVRSRLRMRREYDLADYIREELNKVGVKLEDIGDKTVYYRV